MRLKKILTILMSTMLIVTSINPATIMAYSREASDASDVSDVSGSKILTYANEEDDVIYEIKAEGEKAFEDGINISAEQIEEKELKDYMTDLNESLSQDLLCAEAVLPFEIQLLDEEGEDLPLNQKVKVTLSLSDIEQLEKTILYHQTEEGWEKIPYKATKAVLDKDKNIVQNAYVEFETESFSAFIFAKESELEEDLQETPEEVPEEKQDVSSDDSQEEPKENTEKQTEEKNPVQKSEKEDATNTEDATHTSYKDVDAVSLYNEAAKNKKDAVNALRKDLSFSRRESKAIANELFEEKTEPKLKLAEEDVPRQGDGSNIENISAKWITEDTVDNENAGFLYYRPSGDNSFDIRLQVNYALSGEHNYEPGDITITIPENFIKKRNGKPAGEIILPFPEDPSTKADFNWKLVDGNYVLTNTKRMSAATKGYFQVGIVGLVPHDIVDMEVSEDFDAYIEVTTHKGNTIALRSNKLNAQFDTEAKIVENSVKKRQYGQATRVPASKIPASQRVGDEEEYIVVKWYAFAAISANTYYTLDIVDTLPQDKQVTASGLKESDMHGFIIGATSEDGLKLTKNNVYRGYDSGQTNYCYFETAYPASQFEPNVKYTFHNGVEFKITEVDPAAEVTNANVQAEDPQLITDGESPSQTVFSYRLPEWNNPTGHFMVCKNGNDDKVGNNKTHHSSRTDSDIHIWKHKSPIDSWYGVYPSSLNDLQDGEDVYLSYTIDSVGYTMPWMFNEESYATDNEMAARKSVNYNLPVTMVTEDTGVRYKQSKLKVLDDYEFVSLEFPQKPYVYTGTPKNINPDGSWTALTASDGTFEYVLDSDYSHYPDIILELYKDGEWSEYATVSWKTGTAKITLKNGTEISGAILDIPADTENFRTKVTLQNTLEANSANIISQAAIDYDVRPVVKLINTDAVKNMVEEKFAESHSPSMKVYNSVNMKAYDATNEEITSIDKEGYDVLYGYTTDIAVYPKKTATQTLKDADYVNRQVTVHYFAKVEERSVIHDKTTYLQAIKDGRLAAETHGYWYDLLPKGMTPDTSSITLRKSDKILDVRTVENYKNSGRTLLIVEAELTPVLESYAAGDMTYYEDVPSISFNAKYNFDALTDYGKVVHNVIAFESSNDSLGTIDGYSGEPDNPNTDNNVSTSLAFENENEKTWMTDLDKDKDTPSFVYAGVPTTIDIISAARLSLQKDVMVNNDGRWDTGVFNSDSVTEGDETTYVYNKQSKEDNEMLVWEGGLYAYKLRMMPDAGTRSKDMVIYDSLETFKAGDGNEPIDEMAAKANATWQGSFLGVDVSQLEKKGCKPVVYYSTISNLALSDETDPNVGNKTNMLFKDDGTVNTSVWKESSAYTGDLSEVKAIAIDARKNKDGSDFSLEPLESVVMIINMRAPSGEDARQIIAKEGPWGTSAYAYNNAYLTGTTIDIETHDEDSDNFVRKDYTKVGIKEFKYDVKKIWADSDDRDGKRPESITVSLYADGVDTGRTLVLDKENNWQGAFAHIPYTTPDGTKIRYSVREDDVEGYTKNISGTETSGEITNTYEPEKISLSVSKTWVNDTEDVRPEYIDVVLYGNGTKVRTKRIDKSTDWKCTFDNLYKNENGTPIIYTAKEFFPNGDEKHISYIASEPDGITLTKVPDSEDETQDTFTNTYNPYGELYVSKTVKNTTAVSKEKQFNFTFRFSTIEEEEEVPVFDEFDYDIIDENGEVASSGKVSNNETIGIKGGQKIHVKDMDEYIRYSVTESEEDGFKQEQAQNSSGIIIPNKDNTASFTNKYSAEGRLSLLADKRLNNRELRKYQFKFELYQVIDELDESGNITGTTEKLVKTATSAAPDATQRREDGTVEYSHAVATFGALKYTQEDVNAQARTGKPYRYKIVEVNSGKNGYTYDDTVYYVDVAITDNGDGTLNIVPTYYKEIPPEDGGILDGISDLILGEDDPTYKEVEKAEFINEYKANGEITLRAWKDLQGRQLANEEFEFELIDENNEIIETAKNEEDGTITFPSINFSEKDIGRTFNYAIREKKGNDATVNYDENIFGYSVTVYDNGNGTLSFSQSPATPITEIRNCEECGSTGYIVNDEHPYVMYGPFEGIYSPTENRWVEVFATADMLGPYINWRKYNYRALSCGDDYYDSGRSSFNSTHDNYMLTNIAANLITGDVSNITSNSIGPYVPIDADTISVTDGTDPNIGAVVENKTISYEGALYDLIKSGVSRSYSGMWLLNYYLAQYSECEACNGTGQETIITGWNTEEGELPVFRNTLKDGNLSVSKQISNAEASTPNQKFKFKVKLIGDEIEDKTFDYELSQQAECSVCHGTGGHIVLPEDDYSWDAGDGWVQYYYIQALNDAPEKDKIQEVDEDGLIRITYIGTDLREELGTYITNTDHELEAPANQMIYYYAHDEGYNTQVVGAYCAVCNGTGHVATVVNATSGSGKNASPKIKTQTSDKNTKPDISADEKNNKEDNKPLEKKNDGTNEINEKTLEKTTKDINTDKTTFSKSISSKIMEKIIPPVYAADDDIASGTSGSCSWVIDKDGVMRIYPTNGESGIIASSNDGFWSKQVKWINNQNDVKKLIIEPGVCTNDWCSHIFSFPNCTEMDIANLDTSRATNMYNMFAGCASLISIDVSHFKMDNVTSTHGMFSGCSSLQSIDMSNWNVHKVTYIYGMFKSCSSLKSLDMSNFDGPIAFAGGTFNGCSSLEYLDISNLNTTSASVTTSSDVLRNMFNRCNNLKTIILGDSFRFYGKQKKDNLRKYWAILPTPPESDGYTGKWIREDGLSGPFTPEELQDNYTSEMAGTWIWEKVSNEYTLSFDAGEHGTGAMPPVKVISGEDFTLPLNQFVSFGYEFDHWDDGNGTTYQDRDTIPANTYAVGDNVTLTASFTPRDTTINMENGEFEFEIYGDEIATFKDIPAGTAYQVYEETPDGWVLIEQSNVSGTIQPLETSVASFTNKYEPGTATAQFFGTKTLDGQAAAAESFSFTLRETTEGASGKATILANGEEQEIEFPYTATVSEGGFIQFPIIKYFVDDIGTHTYEIAEVNPNSDRIDYDTHKETVTVNVSGDITKLNTETIIDAEGDGKISFANKTRPGTLKIKKFGENVTETNKDDEFTFKVMLKNDKGLPFSGNDQIYWYKIDSNGNIVQNESNEDADGQDDTNNAKKSALLKVNDTQGALPETLLDEAVRENTKNNNEADIPVKALKTDNTKAAGNIASGTSGTCSWVIDADGVMTIRPKYGTSGMLENHPSGYNYGIFNRYKKDIKKIVVMPGVKTNTQCNWLFGDLSACTEMDLHNLDVSGSYNLSRFFTGCSNLVTLNVSGWNVSNATNTSNMFNGCVKLKNLIGVEGWTLNNVTNTDAMFYSCHSLESLDISGFDLTKATNTRLMFEACINLKSITLGENFKFAGSGSSRAILPTPQPPYTAKWVRSDMAYGPFTPEELRDNYTSDMAGTWITEVDPNNGAIVFNANSGIIIGSNQIIATIDNAEITLFNENNVNRHHYTLKGWNTKADGTGEHYAASALYEVPMGQINTLYAEWEDSHKRDCTVKHYQQKTDLSGYTLVETETIEYDINSSATPPVKTYDGFVSPETQTVEIADDDSTVVEYKYNRAIYHIIYNGNGATTGQMSSQNAVYGASITLNKNTFQKYGSIFKGWNTKIDGNGNTYTDESSVMNLTTENDANVTLYAQWMDNPNEALTPANGEIYVKCKAGETIVIPDLPAGTAYTIEEVEMGDGWSQTGIIDESGTIAANQTNTTTVNNRYEAVGEVELKAHKSMSGDSLTGGEFAFELQQYNSSTYKYETISTVTNDATDKNKTIADEENSVGNPWYNTAPVVFNRIMFTQDDIGKTFKYKIIEKQGNDATITYDETAYYASVVVKDIGKGLLGFDISYSGGNEPVFTNIKKPGELEITKAVISSSNNYKNEQFDFTVELLSSDGTPLDGTFNAKHYNGPSQENYEAIEVSNNDTIHLKDGEKLAITGLPDGATYKVTESPEEGWSLTSAQDSEGTIHSGVTSTARFVNSDERRTEGQAQLAAKKTVIGGIIHDKEDYLFELLDENGEIIQSKNVDVAGGNNSTVTFDPITYTDESVAVPIEYEVQAILMKDGTPEIITLDDYTATLNGTSSSISGTFSWDEAYAGCNRSQVIISIIPKNSQFSEYTKQEVFDMSDKDSVNFTFENVKAYHGGQHKYTIREKKGFDDYTTYDASTYETIVTVIDSGEGYLQTTTEYRKSGKAVSEAEFINKKLADINIVKKDATTLATIPNAKFTLKTNDKYLHSNGTLSDEIEEFVTDNSGHIKVEKVPSGTYTLHETEAPKGYITADDIVFTVDENGTVVNNEAVDEVTVLETRKTQNITIGKMVGGSTGDMNEAFEFEIKFYNITNIQTQFHALAYIFPSGNGTSNHGGISIHSIIPGYGSMSVAEKKQAIAALPLKENGEEKTITAQGTHIQVTAKETTLSGTYRYDGRDFDYRIFVYNDSTNNVYGVCEERTFGTETLTDITDVPSGVTRIAKGRYKFALKHNDTITFENLPYGIRYSVTEKKANLDGYETTATAQVGTVNGAKVVNGTLTNNESITYTNIRNGSVPTGVTNTKLILLLLLTIILIALYLKQKKTN